MRILSTPRAINLALKKNMLVITEDMKHFGQKNVQVDCVAGVNDEGVGIMWQKTRKKGMEEHSILVKKPVSYKQPTLISST